MANTLTEQPMATARPIRAPRSTTKLFRLKPGQGGAGTSWHTDNAYFKVSDPNKGVGLWIALHDATIANGTMHMIPGVYRQKFEHERDGGSDHHITFKAEEDKAVPCELVAGGAIFFNFGVPHCTRANTTDKERAGLAYHFLRTDFVPDRISTGPRKDLNHVTGPEASGGLNEYGVQVAGSWESEVRRLLQAPISN